MSKKINLYREVIRYADNDTDILPKLLFEIDQLIHKSSDCSVLNFPTLGSLTWYNLT